MFSFVRNLFSGNKSEYGTLQSLKDVHTGYTVGFGYMPQSDLSGRRFRVGDVNSYRFGEDTFLAYSLQHTGLISPIQMILELGEEDPYLALSQVVDLSDQKQLFGREISVSDSLFLQDKIVLDVPASHRLSGWAAASYKKVIDGTPGEFMRGHFQLHGGVSSPEPWNFRYYLYVNDTNEYAIEIENFEHGMCKISLTVFRPITDIGQIRKPVAPAAPIVQKKMRSSLPEAMDADTPVIAHEPVVEAAAAPEPVSKTPVMVLSREAIAEKKPDTPRHVLTESLPVIRAESAKAADFALPCPASVAGKLIEESRRSQIPLSQLVRRILGLGIHVDETVIIPCALTPADVAQLSTKFGIEAGDSGQLKRLLLKELSLFAGEEEETDKADKVEKIREYR